MPYLKVPYVIEETGQGQRQVDLYSLTPARSCRLPDGGRGE